MNATPTPDRPAGNLPAKPAFWRPLLLACAAAGVLRVAILDEFVGANPIAEYPWTDAKAYWEWSGRIKQGEIIGPTPFLSAPLYPYFLAVLRLAECDKRTCYIAQIALHLLTAIPIALATRRRFGARCGWLAAVLFLALSEPAMSSTRLIASTLQLAIVAMLWWVWVSWIEHASQGRSAASVIVGESEPVDESDNSDPASAQPVSVDSAAPPQHSFAGGALGAILVGLLALAWPPAMLLVPIYAFSLWWLRRGTHRWIAGGVGAGVALLTISPAALHNYKVAGEFIPITAHAGITLRQGNAPSSGGIYTYVEGVSGARSQMHTDAAKVFEKANGRPGSWREIDEYFRRQAVEYWREDPVRAVRLFATKAWWYLTSWRYDDMMPVYLEQECGVANRAMLAPLAVPWLMGAALAGLLALLRAPRRYVPEWSILLLTFAVTIIFFYTPRYRLPAIPVLCGLAAYAIENWRRFWYPSVIAAALMVLPAPIHYLNREIRFDDLDFMRPLFRDSLAKTFQEVGDISMAKGDLAVAEARYQSALRVQPEHAPSLRQLGILFGKTQRVDEAEKSLSRAIRADPNDALAYKNLYNALLLKKDFPRAAGIVRRAAQLDPQDPSAHAALAWMLATCPLDDVRNGRQAIAAAKKLLDSGAGDRAAALDILAAAFAEDGQFAEAISTANTALDLSRQQGSAKLAAEIERRLAGYRQNQPCRAPPRPVQPRPRTGGAAGS